MRSPADAAMEWTHGNNQESMDIARWGTLAGAALVMAYGVSRRSIPGFCVAAAAAPFAYRGLAGQWPTRADVHPRDRAARLRQALAGERGFKVREAIRLEKPLSDVYQFWRTLENLPLFMAHLERVTDLGGDRSRWVARGPAGVRVEWDAEIINDVENQVIAWRSLPGAEVDSAGSVNFDAMRAGQCTQVTVSLQYAPPAGRAGKWVATLMGREPSQLIREDLRRLKQQLEAGEMPRASATEPVGASR